jgi:hypothetical protein
MLDFLQGAVLFFRKLIGASFPSWCNVYHGNAFVLVIEGKLAWLGFLRSAMLFFIMHLFLWHKES